MQRIIAAFATLTAISLTFSACGGDDDDSGGNAGSGNAAGKPSNTGGGGTSSTPGEGGTPPTGNVPCDADQETTCQNEQDCRFVVDGSARAAAQTCGKEECLTSSDEDCARDCMLKELDISSECASCYADLVKCAIANCVAACIGDPDSDDCYECQATKGCRATFDECSGLTE